MPPKQPAKKSDGRPPAAKATSKRPNGARDKAVNRAVALLREGKEHKALVAAGDLAGAKRLEAEVKARVYGLAKYCWTPVKGPKGPKKGGGGSGGTGSGGAGGSAIAT